ncbi:glutathione transferase [Myxococcus stipitatus DSM 14675]|uniref:Glutathione transferase n=1 Tax=Myxococcus stipitatus (strain DSM 14675 / JCM 12634 / Mx s8) TaxID=1278073 RepID=L7UGI8_MYXSD|nr:VOC family protein [Myxococcus stipitatus]AGC45559.1 glutathione transferase [Myxococcus stipitatus DSM 14675]
MDTSTPAPRIAGFHHLTAPVDDLEVAERFYVGLLGAVLVRRLDRATFLRVRPDRASEVDASNSPLHLAVRWGAPPELHLFLQRERRKPVPPPHPHLAMQVAPEALDTFVQRLRAAGVPLDGPRRLGPPGQASVYFADPFGNTLELVTLGYTGAVVEGPPEVGVLGG